MSVVFSIFWLIAWVVSSRLLFRYWVRNDAFTVYDSRCSCGFLTVHKGKPCHGKHTNSRIFIATIAMLASSFLPVTLMYLAVMYRPPVSQAEREAKLAQLEAENARLRRIVE